MDYYEALIFWSIIGAVLGALIVSRKGWHWLVGVLIGAALGPIFVWLCLFASDNNKGLNRKKCPYCAEWIKEKATVCKFCHKEMPPEIPGIAPQPH
jgi:MFS family permease